MNESFGERILSYTTSVVKKREEEKKAKHKKLVIDTLINWAQQAGISGSKFHHDDKTGELNFLIKGIEDLSQDEVTEIIMGLGLSVYNRVTEVRPRITLPAQNDFSRELYATYERYLEVFKANERKNAAEDLEKVIKMIENIENLPESECVVLSEGCFDLVFSPKITAKSCSTWYQYYVNEKLREYSLSAVTYDGWWRISVSL